MAAAAAAARPPLGGPALRRPRPRRPPGGVRRLQQQQLPAVVVAVVPQRPRRPSRLATPRPAAAAPPTDAAVAPPPFLHTPPAPTLRCALCYELGFSTRAALADHLVGPAHTRHWGPILVAAGRSVRGGPKAGGAEASAAAAAAGVACPYCGEPAPRGGPDAPAAYHPMRWLRRHVSGGDCGRRRRGGGGGGEEDETSTTLPDPVACFEPPPPAGAPPWVDLRAGGGAWARYAPLVSQPCPPELAASLGLRAAPGGAAATLTVRPLHPSRAHALAAVLTAAFAGDPDPPTYAWLARELAREAARFEAEGGDEGGLELGSGRLTLPTPPLPSDTCRTGGGGGGGSPRWWRIGRGREAAAVNGDDSATEPATAPPGRRGGTAPATGSGPPRRGPLSPSSSSFAAADAEDDDDEWRVRLEEAWGRWLWLVAEVEGGDVSEPRETRDVPPPTRVLGGAALLLHDRAPALDALQALDPAGSPASMDFALWLTSDPSPAATAGCGGRGAWLWWAGVDPRARRAGVGASLVSAAEVAAAGLGLDALYVQALAPPPRALQDGGGLGALAAGLWGGQAPARDPGAAARALYERAGYTPLPPPAGASKKGGPGGGYGVAWWGGGGRSPPPAVDASAVMLGKWLGPPGGGGAWWEAEGV
jgi:GNAT superfamily N-acetyltransferase